MINRDTFYLILCFAVFCVGILTMGYFWTKSVADSHAIAFCQNNGGTWGGNDERCIWPGE